MPRGRLRIRFSKRNLLKLDLIDFGLLGTATGSALVHRFHPKLRKKALKLREEKRMRKLKIDLERQSPIIQSSPSGLFPKVQEKDRQKYQKLYSKAYKKAVIKFYWYHLIRVRGGELAPLERLWEELDLDNNDEPVTEKLLLKVSYRFSVFLLTLLSILKNKEVDPRVQKGILKKLFYREVRCRLQKLLLRYSIHIGYERYGSYFMPVVTFLGGVVHGAAISMWVPLLKDTAAATVGAPLGILAAKKFLESFYWVPDEERLVKEFIETLKKKDVKSIDEYFRSLSREIQEERRNSNRIKFTDLELELDLSDSEKITCFLGAVKKHPEEMVLPEVNPFEKIGRLPTKSTVKLLKKNTVKSRVSNLSKLIKNEADDFLTNFQDEEIVKDFELIRIKIQD